MDPFLLGILVGIPLAWHLGMAWYAYHDAGRNGMNQRKWGTIALLVPFFGFFAYIFERDERNRGPEPDLFADGPFKIHRSRADEAPFATASEAADDVEGSVEEPVEGGLEEPVEGGDVPYGSTTGSVHQADDDHHDETGRD